MIAEPATPLRLSEAAWLFGVETKAVARLVHERRIRLVMVDGIAHITKEALDEYRRGGP